MAARWTWRCAGRTTSSGKVTVRKQEGTEPGRSKGHRPIASRRSKVAKCSVRPSRPLRATVQKTARDLLVARHWDYRGGVLGAWDIVGLY